MAQKLQIPENKPKLPLNEAQKAAAEAKKGPLLIVAGAGTGKTKTLTSRIAYFIEAGIAPERICAITFTNKAAKEMARRVGRTGPLIGTFHSLGSRILRKEARALGRGPNFTIFDDHDSFDLIKKTVKKILPPTKEAVPKNKKQETPVLFAKKIAEIKNLEGAFAELSGEKGGKPPSEKEALALRVFEKYETALRENNAFDFDDLIEKVVTLWKNNPAILKKYQDMFDAVLVDEYQDINPRQHELIALLSRGHKNLSVVGDDEQTIYSWRYADVKMFLGFEKEWQGVGIHFLEENYRSTGTIIRAAAAVAKNNRFRAPKNLWTSNPDGEPITLLEAWGENEEGEWIASSIAPLFTKISKGEGEDSEPPSVAVLYRTNAQSRAIEQALIRYDIPYRIFGGLKFYERREIKDAVAALRYISNRKDTVAKERLEKNLTKRRFAEFQKKLDNTGPAGQYQQPLDAIKLFLDTFGYMEYLEENFTNSDEREENIAELITFAGGFETLDELLERLSLLQSTDDEQTGDAAKNKTMGEAHLMTIHMAKGLEFDTVFIAGAAEGFLPHGRSLDNEDSLEEERRLMYVAMTRARKKLNISFYGMPSRFISEIPADCIALAGDGSDHPENNDEVDTGAGEERTVYWD